ncbi:MAG TPA: TonB-dependent receptor [Candidatus Saccharimonadales bacterium]|nr:TonB-dependent receptor [Candidatus Saccharimonadales bacterium]
MTRSFRTLCTCVCVLTVLILSVGPVANSQTFRGTILGTVTDSSGAAVPGATVTIKNVDTGLTRAVTTTDTGDYSVPELPLGTYTISVEKSGFKVAIVSGVKVDVQSERRADVILLPGELAQRVEVVGDELSVVETTANTLGNIMEAKVAQNLPVNGGDYLKLIFLTPGVAGSPDMITDSPGSFGTFSVNGGRGRSNNFLLDGTDMNDGYRNDPAINEAGVFGTPATILPIESVAELHVASNFEAEYGRSAGGVINIVTKSGTNAFHGSVSEYFRNTVLNARNYFNDAVDSNTGASIPQNPFHNNQFGGYLGGPIIKDRTFFFVDYNGVRETGALSSLACVPTQADFATAIANNGGVVNPVIANLLALPNKIWPNPTNGNDCYADPNAGPNASLATPFSNDVDSGIIKIDHSFNPNHMLTGRYYIGNSTQSFPLALVGGGLVPGYNTYTPTRVQLVSISYVATITPNVVNEARLGWNRFAEGFFPQDRSFDPTSIGLNTIEPGSPNQGTYNMGLPKITVGSPGSALPPLGADGGDPRQRVDSNWHFIDGLSWKVGRQDVKFGLEFRRTSVSQIFNRGFRGTLDFSSLDTFIAGIPDNGGSQRQGNTNRNTLENSYAAYIQDSIKVSRKVTVNLGLRYDYFGIIQEKHGNFTNIDPTTGIGYPVGSGRLYQPDYNNWAPRISVAWDLTGRGKTVLRAGYGIFYDAFSQDMFMGHLPWNSSFDPGAAYNGFVGPNLISTANVNSVPLSANLPVYGAPGPMGDAFGVDTHIRTPYMENYNLNFQQELARRVTLQVGYVGSQGHKLFRFRDINQPTLQQIQQFNYGGPGAGDGCYCVPRFFPNSPYYYINYQESSANSIYNSLQTSWRIDNWHGLTSAVNYTWSHSIDDASDGEDFVPNAAQPDNSQGLIKYNRGNSNFDIRNRFTWNFIYQIPDSHDSNWKALRNGWGVNGILTLQSGQPFQLNYNFEDDYNGSGEGFGRPDIVGKPVYNYSDPRNFLQLSSFAIPCVLSGGTGAGSCQLINPSTGAICTPSGIGPNCINSMHFGTLGRNSLLGPNFKQFDFAVFKDTRLTERLTMQLRFEAYNLFNHPNFANPYLPNFIADAAPNGFNSNGTSAGVLPLTATGDVGIGYPYLGSGGPRGMQVVAKFSF